MVKIYEILWAIIAIFAALIFITGNMTLMIGIAFGFVCFGMIFMGMMFILPASVAHSHHPEPVRKVKTVRAKDFVPTGAVHVR